MPLDPPPPTEFSSVKDSGARQKWATGAVRDLGAGKGRYDLLLSLTHTLYRLARHFENGAVKYGDDNWRKGIPLRRYLDSAQRHLCQFAAGLTDEDHLLASIWNLCCLCETQHEIFLGHLPSSLANLPRPRCPADDPAPGLYNLLDAIHPLPDKPQVPSAIFPGTFVDAPPETTLPDSPKRRSILTETADGRALDLCHPRPSAFSIKAIAHALSNLCRFGGATKEFYSVAEHSVHCSTLSEMSGDPPYVQLCALLHDAAEAYIGDLTTPVKRWLNLPKGFDLPLRQHLQLAMCLPLIDSKTDRRIKNYDSRMLQLEAAVLLPSCGSGPVWASYQARLQNTCTASVALRCWPPDEARSQFLNRYHEIHQAMKPSWEGTPNAQE